MMLTLAGAKGGVGTTTVAAACAVTAAHDGADVLLVDAAGNLGPSDAACALGLPAGVRIAWPTAVRADGPGARLEVVRAVDPVDIAHAIDDTAAAVVIVDAGTVDQRERLALAVDLGPWCVVLRESYLDLARLAVTDGIGHRASSSAGMVIVQEPGRALGPTDLEQTLSLPTVARVAVRANVARAVDAGTLAVRCPDHLRDSARRILAAAERSKAAA